MKAAGKFLSHRTASRLQTNLRYSTQLTSQRSQIRRVCRIIEVSPMHLGSSTTHRGAYANIKHLLCILFLKLTPCSRVLPGKLNDPQLVKKFPAYYSNRRFITASTTACHLSLSWTRSIRSIPASYCSKTHFSSILSSTPRSSKWSPSLRFPH
jgi:hypothetical protein